MKLLKKIGLAFTALALVLVGTTPAHASGTYKTWTGQVNDFTQAYVWQGQWFAPLVTVTTHFETTLTNPPYGYFCKTPDMGLGDGTSTCWYAGSNELWANQTVEIGCYNYDPYTGYKVVKMAWGLKGQTKPSRFAYYRDDGENGTSAEINSTGHC